MHPMTTLYITHPAALDHIPPLGHPERPDRIRVVDRVLEQEAFQSLARDQAPVCAIDRIALCHTQDYIDAIREAAPTEGMVQLDSDTSMSPGTYEAALRAVGGAVLAVDEVMTGRVANAFCAMRPPGHHAEITQPKGFCFFNNAAIAARHARDRHGAERVAVIDFDVHHGNGTQDIFYTRCDVLFVSLHADPVQEYPYYLGFSDETGEGAGEGANVNYPLPFGTGFEAWRAALDDALSRIAAFRADALVVSLGVDTYEGDPISRFRLDTADYPVIGAALAGAGLPTLFVMEGGYAVEAIGVNAVGVLQGFADAA